MASDDIKQIVDDVANDANQPPDDSTQTKDKAPKYGWFKQPPRPPTPDPECNKRQVVVDQPEQPWFNKMVSTAKDPLTFDKLMATLIYFFKYAMNRLKIDNLTQAYLVGPVYELLKGTCKSSIELKYNMEDRPGRLTVAAEYFFNNDMEFLKSSDPQNKYTTPITKTKTSINKFSKHKVYSTQKILSVVNVKVERLHGDGHLDEIVVKRAYRQLYKFKEGDFIDLHLNDIEDMILLKTFLGIEFKELYTPSFDPLGVIYEDLNKQKRVMRADEVYKFSDGTLKTVRDELHHRLLDFQLGYNDDMPRRKWTGVVKRRLGLMVELIDKKMLERRIIRNLERLVGTQELEMDYRLMTRTE
ncbi:hypothetical protein Tco_1220639 [Tanacetum coccineum]